MFSKSRINEPGPAKPEEGTAAPTASAAPAAPKPSLDSKPVAPKAKPPASVLSSDLIVTGNLKTPVTFRWKAPSKATYAPIF